MFEGQNRAVKTTDKAHERAAAVLADLAAVASADKVFGEPVVAGDRTIITAAEIQTGLGFGYGLSTGTRGEGDQAAKSEANAREVSWGRGRRDRDGEGPSAGGGGGGHATGRPVAVVTIDPDGVHVQPVLDRTKVVLTALTAIGAIGLALIRLRSAVRSAAPSSSFARPFRR